MRASLLPPSDATLVKRSLGGEAEAFEGLVFRYQAKGQAIARALGVPQGAVDDVVQEAFLRAYRSLGRLEKPESFGPWFVAIAKNVARKHLRASGRLALTPDLDRREGSSSDTLEERELGERVWAEVAELPESVREAVFLYYYEGESTRKVARSLGISVTGVKNRLRTGRELLRRRLWRTLGETLRRARPSPRERRRAARRLSLVVVSTLGSAGAEGAIAAAGTATTTAPSFISGVQTAGVLTMTAKKIAAIVLFCVLLFGAGFLGGSLSRPPPSVSVRAADSSPTTPARPRARPSRQVARAEPPPAEEPPARVVEVETPPPAPTTGDVRVTVLRAVGDEPAVDIGVRLVPRHRPSPSWGEFFARTDARGQATLEGIPPGRWIAGFDRARLKGRWPGIEVAAGETTEVRLLLSQGIRVEGEVVDWAGFPVPGADVLVSRDEFDGFSAHRLTTSGPDGRFVIEDADRGRYVSARKEGYAPSRQHALSADPGSTSELRLVLPEAGGALIGRVLDREGGTIPDALVMAGNRDIRHGVYEVPAAPVVRRTDAEGAFSAVGLPSGRVPVVARAPGFAPRETTVLVEAGRTTALDLVLEPGVVVQGTVFAASGDPVEGASLRVGSDEPFVDGTDPLVTRTRTGPDGRYRLAGLAAGRFTIHVSAEDRGKARPTIDSLPGETLELDIELAPPLEIRGRVVLEDGTPLAGAGVSAPGLVWEETGPDGRFVLENCKDREYRVGITERRQPGVPCAGKLVRPGEDEVEIVVREEDRATAIAEGTVVDADGWSVRSARVQFKPAGRQREERGLFWYTAVRAESGFSGDFRIGPVPPGEYQIAVEADGWPRTWLENVKLDAGARAGVGTLRLARPGWLRVELAGAPSAHEGGRLVVRDREERVLIAAPLSSDPEHREPLVPGRHRVVVYGPDREEKLAREFEVVAGRESVLRLEAEGDAR